MDNYTCSLCGAVFTFAEDAAKHYLGCKKNTSNDDWRNEKYWNDLNEKLQRIKEALETHSFNRPNSNHRLNAVVNLIRRGATPGERVAARCAYRRLTGKEFIG